MPRPRRFTSSYGMSTMDLTGQSTYKTASGQLETWNPTLTGYVKQASIMAYRQPPINGDYRTATPWGVFAERLFIKPVFKYHSSSYFWYGENSVSTAKLPVKYPTSVGTWTVGTGVVVNLNSSIVNAARNAARGNIANQAIDLATTLGETKETIATLSELVVRVARALRHARKGRFRRALQALNGGKVRSVKNAADNYLAFVYGLTPHLRDVHGLQEQVKRGLAREGKYFRSTGFKSSNAPWTEFFLSSLDLDSHRGSGGGRGWCKVVLYQTITHEVAYQLNQLGVANPLNTVWELVPLSFVVDWFIPIGDFLRALTGPLGTTFSHGYEDHVIEADVTVDFCRYGWSTFKKGTTPSYHWQMFVFQRRVLTTNPPSRLYIGTGLIQSVQRSLSTVALLRQRS